MAVSLDGTYKDLLFETASRFTEILTRHMEEYAAAWLQRTNLDPRDAMIVVEHCSNFGGPVMRITIKRREAEPPVERGIW